MGEKINAKARGHYCIFSHKIVTIDNTKRLLLKKKVQLKQVLKRVIGGTFANFELIRFSLNF